jgi:hypothetical protein
MPELLRNRQQIFPSETSRRLADALNQCLILNYQRAISLESSAAGGQVAPL